MNLKEVTRKALNFLHLDLTKNLEYDRLTKTIMNRSIVDGWNCVDVGCHKGEILDIILKNSPSGHHWAFEPIPTFYDQLKEKYSGKTQILDIALSDKSGKTQFNYVKNAPAYSGINKRKYQIENPDISEIEVELGKLDDIIPSDQAINFIKIDVEGAEYFVLKGGINTLKRTGTMIVFEFGLGASDYYGTTPEGMFGLIEKDLCKKIYSLKSWLNQDPPYSKQGFIDSYNNSEEYYFLAV